MSPDDEPTTDQELAQRLRALYVASNHSGGARDDFWDCVSYHVGWIIDLVEIAAKIKKRRNETPNPKSQEAGRLRAASLSPERRSEIARKAANARWNGSKEPTQMASIEIKDHPHLTAKEPFVGEFKIGEQEK